MTRTAIQLHTLRALDESVPGLVRRVGETPLEGVEFAGLDDADPVDVAAALDETGLDVAGAHVGLEPLRRSFADTVSQYETVGCDTLVVPAADPESFESVDAVADLAAELNGLANDLAAHGMRIGYHNHSFEFGELADGRLALDHLVEETVEDVAIELDVGLATWSGADPLQLLERYGDRVDLVHITDTVPGDEDRVHADYGTGEVNLHACADLASEIGAEWAIYEHGRATDEIGALEEAAEHLPKLLE